MRLSDRIRTARHLKGWKQADLAAMLEVDRSAVGHWERGEGSAPSLARLFALAGVTGVCVEWLATGTGPMVAAGDTSTAVSLGADESRLLRAYRQRSTRAKAALLELAESDYAAPPPAIDSQPVDRGLRGALNKHSRLSSERWNQLQTATWAPALLAMRAHPSGRLRRSGAARLVAAVPA